MSSKAKVNIITQFATDEHKKNYEVKISVCSSDKVNNSAAKTNNDINGQFSPEILLSLTEGECDIQVSVSGALKPKSPFEEGEGTVEYNEILPRCEKFLYLVPTYDKRNNGNATIKFWANNKHKHTVHINDIPTNPTDNADACTSTNERALKTVEQSMKSLNLNRNEDTVGANVSVKGKKSEELRKEKQKRLSESSTADTALQSVAGSVHERLDAAEGGSYVEENQALPLPPTQTDEVDCGGGGVEYVPPSDEDDEVETDLSDEIVAQASADTRNLDTSHRKISDLPEHGQEEEACKNILGDGSLIVLAGWLGNTAPRLILQLGLGKSDLDSCLSNNPRDVSQAHFDGLRMWRNDMRSGSQRNVGYAVLFEDLLLQLEDLGRNDIKTTIQRVKGENRKLRGADLK